MTERLEQIKNQLMLNHRVTVNELSRQYGVSEVTIRHDLGILEREGYAKRIFGGAIRCDSAASLIAPQSPENPTLDAIAAKAAELVEDGDCLYLGIGQTCCYFAKYLHHFHDLIVYTNNIAAIGDLVNAKARICLLGGELCYQSTSTPMTFPDDAAYAKAQPFVTKAFTSVYGIDLRAGLTDHYDNIATMCRLIPAKATEWILMVDHHKFNRISIYEAGHLEDVNHLVSDKVPQNYLAAARRCGMEVHLALS